MLQKLHFLQGPEQGKHVSCLLTRFQVLCSYAVRVQPMVHPVQLISGTAKEPHEADPHMDQCSLERPPSSETPSTRLVGPI